MSRHFGLRLQLLKIAIEFTQNVFHPRQVETGILQTTLGFTAPFLVLGNPCRLFQKESQFLWLALDDAADGPLTDDGVGARPQTRPQKDVLHITPAHRLIVDVVAAGAVARENPFDRNFYKLTPLPAGAVVGIVKNQFNAGATRRFATGRTVEDDVLHRLATQFGSLGLAQHPTHCIHDVGFAATIRSNHSNELPRQQKIGWVNERFETR